MFCQRHPWWTSVVVALTIGFFAGPWTMELCDRHSPDTVMTLMMLIPAAVSCLAHVGRGGRTTSDRLAPWLAANVAVVATSLAYSEMPSWGVRFTSALIVLMPFAVWPLVTAVLLPGDPPGDETPAALLGYPLTLVLFPPILAAVFRDRDTWAIGTAFCLALVPLAMHAVVRCRWPTGNVVGGAMLLGAASYVLRLAQMTIWSATWDDFHSRRRGMLPFLPVVVWVACALMAVAARRCRSMTAVPADHPIVEDFGAAASGSALVRVGLRRAQTDSESR